MFRKTAWIQFRFQWCHQTYWLISQIKMSVFFSNWKKTPFGRLGSFGKAVRVQKAWALGLGIQNSHRLQLKEFTESNFIFLLVSHERILNQKTLEKKGPWVSNLSLTFQVEGQAGKGREVSPERQGVPSPPRIPGLWIPAQGSPHLENPKVRRAVPLRLCQTPERLQMLLGFSHICFSDGDRQERWVKTSPGTSTFQQLSCLIPD